MIWWHHFQKLGRLITTIYLKPRVFRPKGGGRVGGAQGWIDTLLNVICNFKELK